MNKVFVSDLMNKKTIFIARLGRPMFSLSYGGDDNSWDGMIIPVELPIRCVEIHRIYEPLIHNIDEFYATFHIGDIYDEFKYNINLDDSLELDFKYIISFDKEEVERDFIFRVKDTLSKRWSSQNGVFTYDLLKQHIVKNELEYFEKDYPELLV